MVFKSRNDDGSVRRLFLPPANEVWGKVIFSEACVKNSVYRGVGAWSGGVPGRGVPGPRGVLGPRGCLVLGRVPGPRGMPGPMGAWSQEVTGTGGPQAHNQGGN